MTSSVLHSVASLFPTEASLATTEAEGNIAFMWDPYGLITWTREVISDPEEVQKV